MFEHFMHTGKPLLLVADAAGIVTIIAAWLGLLPIVFTAFATFWASVYYMAMFYQSDLGRQIVGWVKWKLKGK